MGLGLYAAFAKLCGLLRGKVTGFAILSRELYRVRLLK